MQSAILGVPYKIAYDAVKFRSGLTDVSVTILRPDLTLFAELLLSEVSLLPGLYVRDLVTTTSEQTGKWLYRVSSPTEGIVRDGSVYMEAPGAPSGDPWAIAISGDQVAGTFGDYVVNKVLSVSKFLGLQ